MNIIILDDTLTQISVLTNYISLIFERNYDGMGQFRIDVNLNQKNAEELKLGRIIYLDSLRCGIIDEVVIDRVENKANEILTVSGTELKDVISRRVVETPAQSFVTEYYEKTTEYIVRDLINNNLVNPTDTNRKIDIFQLADDAGLGTEITKNYKCSPLSTYIYNNGLLAYDELGLKCDTNLITKKATLSVYKGVDRTYSQSQNPAAVFSLKLATFLESRLQKDIYGYINLIYVSNGQIGAGREVLPVYDTVQSTPTGIGRIEDFVYDEECLTTALLREKGELILKTHSHQISLDGVAGRTEPDYDLGDLVTFLDYDSSEIIDMRVKRIRYTYSGTNKETKEIIFGKAPWSLSRAFDAQVMPIKEEYLK